MRVLIALTMLAWTLAGCAEPPSERELVPPSEPSTSDTVERSSPSVTPPADSAEPDYETNDEVAGDSTIDPGLVELLGSQADYYGYGLGPGTPLSFEQAEDLAGILALTCEAVASGTTTWEDVIATDVADGAPPADARGFNAFLESRFCPSLQDSGGGDPVPSADPTGPVPRCPRLVDLDPELSVQEVPGGDGVTHRIEADLRLQNPRTYPITVWIFFDTDAYFDEDREGDSGGINGYRWLKVAGGMTRTFTFGADWIASSPEPDVRLGSWMVDDKDPLGSHIDCRQISGSSD